MIIKDTKKFLRFIILMLVSYLLVACSAELDQARPVNFAVINSQNSTSQEMCQEGIQATFTMLSDQSEYASPRLGVGEEYRSESSGFYTSQDKVRISVQCFEANNVTGVLVVEGNIKPNHFINLPINAPPRVFLDALILDLIKFVFQFVFLNRFVPCAYAGQSHTL